MTRWQEPQTKLSGWSTSTSGQEKYIGTYAKSFASVYTHVWRKFVESITEKEFQNEDEVYVYIISTLSTRWKKQMLVFTVILQEEIYVLKIYFNGSKDSDRWERIYLCN